MFLLHLGGGGWGGGGGGGEENGYSEDTALLFREVGTGHWEDNQMKLLQVHNHQMLTEVLPCIKFDAV